MKINNHKQINRSIINYGPTDSPWRLDTSVNVTVTFVFLYFPEIHLHLQELSLNLAVLLLGENHGTC